MGLVWVVIPLVLFSIFVIQTQYVEAEYPGYGGSRNVVCDKNFVLMFKHNGFAACVKPETSVKLVERGWGNIAKLVFENHDKTEFFPTTKPLSRFSGQIECVENYSNSNDKKFDSGLLDKVFALIDIGETRDYSVIMWVSDENKDQVVAILTDCHGASNVFKADRLSFVTANVPLYEIPKLSGYGMIGKIGKGELFELPVSLPSVEGKSWVQIDPIQCANNPWEQYWIESHGNDYSSLRGMDEFVIVKNYFEKQGIMIYEFNTARTYQTVQTSCSSPAGHTLYLLVSEEDVDKMLNLGFKLSEN